MNIKLSEYVTELSSIKLFGALVDDFDTEIFSGTKIKSTDRVMHLAKVRAYSVGYFCTILPSPILLVVFGEGKDVTTIDTCGKPGEKVWSIYKSDQSIVINFNQGSVLDLLEAAEDFGASGGITFDNPRIENGYVRTNIHVWAKIEIFGAKVSMDENFPISVPLQGCHTVYEFGFGSVKVCVSAASNGIDLCAKLCIGKFGIEKCFDACTHIGFKLENLSSKSICKCTE